MEDRIIRTTERLYLGLALKIVCGILLLIGLGWGGRKAFLRLQERRLMEQVRLSSEKHDDRWTAIAAHRVVELNPENADACRVLADLVERQGQPVAVDWRKRVVAIRPDSIEDAIALARTARRFGQTATADQALEKVAARAGATASFHHVKGELAVDRKDSVAAETELAEAARLEPTNKIYQLDLAVCRLRNNSADERARAMLQIQQFTEDPELRVAAAQALRDSALERRDGQAAFENARLLASFPEADFRSRLYFVQMLRQLGHADFAVRLLDAENEAASDPEKIYQILTWMSTSGLQVLAIDWVKRLPPAITAKRPVVAAVADCYGASKDWTGLEQWSRTTDWADLDFLRHAALSRALREQGRSLDWEREWNVAAKAVRNDGARISALQQKVATWGWKAESADLLWQLATDPQRQDAALTALYQHYASEGDTSDLYRVAVRLAELRPNDAEVENNVAQLGLLLNLDRRRTSDLARKVHEENPTNPVFTSTFAFALYTQGKYADAVNTLRLLKEEDLRLPAIAAYYGITLAAAGEKEKAREFLQIGRTASLLPEERILLERALAGASAP